MINEQNAKSYCSEDISLIENYHKAIADKDKMWHCHHRLEISSNGERISHKDLIKQGLYYNRPASELIFLTNIEHKRLHQSGKKLSDETKIKISKYRSGKQMSEKQKRKISESMRGKKRPPRSEEWKRKISEANCGKTFSEETRMKISFARKAYLEMKKMMTNELTLTIIITFYL